MGSGSRQHQCLVYGGPPSKHLRAVAAAAREMLAKNYRCLYLNNEPMVAGFRSYLAAEGVDVEQASRSGALAFVSDQSHLAAGRFDLDAMLAGLEAALNDALVSGHAGLWASGDMTWEFGQEKDFSKLFEYECRLEEFMRARPQICGICQYHAESLPPEVIREGVRVHQWAFVNETLSLMNPHCMAGSGSASGGLDHFVSRLLKLQDEL